MPKLGRDYRDWLLEELRDPVKAEAYLNAVLEEGAVLEEEDPAALLLALRDVAEARQMARVAKDAGVERESLYRMLSENGNPRYSSLVGILKAIGFRLALKSLYYPSDTGEAQDSKASSVDQQPDILTS